MNIIVEIILLRLVGGTSVGVVLVEGGASVCGVSVWCCVVTNGPGPGSEGVEGVADSHCRLLGGDQSRLHLESCWSFVISIRS